MTSPIIVLFRRDFRLIDNPSLHYACQRGEIIPLFIYEKSDSDKNHIDFGGASKWWLHHTLANFSNTLNSIGGKLIIGSNNPLETILDVAKQFNSSHIVWNRRYEPKNIQKDSLLKQQLSDNNIKVNSFNASLLAEPWETLNKQDKPYKVFTPYWRQCLANHIVAPPLPRPETIHFHPSLNTLNQTDTSIDSLQLLDRKVNWAQGISEQWDVGEQSAQEKWQVFLSEAINDYKENRNLPSIQGTSRLSPHICFGEISVRQIWHDIHNYLELDTNPDAACYLSEIGWREFSYYLLYHFPHITTENYNPKFDHFQWRNKPNELLTAWQQGNTGYPIVDAGMRELWQTGYMHNRVRMIVASFLCKHLLIDWREGAKWFWDTLVDADLASNTASWQWVAGCGADAAPYFRIFNPITQGEKFDANGEYTRLWVPELSSIDKKYLYQPWSAPTAILNHAKIELGKTYPKPIVDHSAARTLALNTYSELKKVG